MQAQATLTALEDRLAAVIRSSALSAEARSRAITDLEGQLSEARERFVRVYREATQLEFANLPQRDAARELSIDRLASWLRSRDGALLYYYQAANSVWLLTVVPDAPPKWERLDVSPALAEHCGCTAGPLTRAALNSVLAVDDRLLLQAYFGEPVGDALQRAFDAMKVASTLREALWAMVSAIHLAAPGADYRAHAADYLARTEEALARFVETHGNPVPSS